MIWETDPSLRNKKNEIKFIVPADQEIKTGDVLVGQYSAENTSCYEITEIKNRRESNLKSKDYITALTSWTNKKPDFSNFTINTTERFKKLYNIN